MFRESEFLASRSIGNVMFVKPRNRDNQALVYINDCVLLIATELIVDLTSVFGSL